MQSPPGPSPEPGERRRLDHPPSDRFAHDEPAAAPAGEVSADGSVGSAERVLRAIAVGIVGVIGMTLLGGPLSVTAGLVGAAGVIGWVMGMVARPMRLAAVLIALASVAGGLLGIWLYAGLEGGALGLLDYLGQVQGILVPIELVAAGVLAWAASGS
jgi:hypothetical protein